MNLEDIIRFIEGVATEVGGSVERIDERSILVNVPRNGLRRVVKELYSRGARLRTCAGVDEREVNNRFALYHILGFDSEGLDVIVKVSAGEGERIPSIADIIPGAEWCEREARDLLCLDIEGLEGMPKLVVSED
jgi:Ni,Fe-hydrogenase III component G